MTEIRLKNKKKILVGIREIVIKKAFLISFQKLS